MGSNGSFYQNGLPISEDETGLGNVPAGLPAPKTAESSFYLSGTAFTQAIPDIAEAFADQAAASAAASSASAAAAAASAAAAVVTLSTSLLKANNLSDVTSALTSRTNLGLGNVDNTSDTNKPVSTAQATADALVASNAAAATALKANIASPTFTGTPAAPTAAVGTNTTQLATTAFVSRIATQDTTYTNLLHPNGAIALYLGGTANPANLYINDTHTFKSAGSISTFLSVSASGAAFSVQPTAATPSANDNSTKLATTAYADAIAALKANLASPTFTGTPAAPTAAPGTNTTQLATTAFVVAATREKLTANRTYFVRTDGSNSNTGLVNSAGGAFLTLQKAYDVISSSLDLAGFTVTISLVNTSSPSTFTGGLAIAQPWTGGGAVTVQGSTGTATDVVISTTSAHCTSTTGSLPGTLTLKDMKLQTTTSGDCILHQATGLVQFSNLNFGACAGAHIDAVGSGVNLECTGNYAISGNAGFAHVVASRPANVSIRSKTVTLSGTPAFTSAFAFAANGGVIAIDGCTFSGAGTGTRFSAQNGGQIYTNGSGTTYLPGNAVGSGTNFGTSPYGLYV